jgi:tRNA nucleotidyltransferase/poly(A) polymerase
VSRLRGSGHVAYFAGGCVRDELLGLSPTDYDVATDAPPQRIQSLFRRTAEVGAAFGVVLVTPGKDEGAPDPATVEVATFRSDGPYSDSRRPDVVTFSTPEADAKRRDFTVNALFRDPMDESARKGGRVIDFVGGETDLNRRVIRAVAILRRDWQRITCGLCARCDLPHDSALRLTRSPRPRSQPTLENSRV